MDTQRKKAFGLALNHISRRDRSTLEMDNYLSKKGFTSLVVKGVVQELQEKNYLNDKMFAIKYLENRKRNKPKSLFALGFELKKKGIDVTIIDKLLTGYDDLELASLAIEPKIRLWQHLDVEVLKKKVFGYLRYRGFGFSVIQSTWQHIELLSRDPISQMPKKRHISKK